MADQSTPGGAMPPAAGARPAQTSPAPTGSSEPSAASQPATGGAASGEGALGETGKKALEAERQARRDAEQAARDARAELEKLKTAGLSAEERRTKRLSDLEREQADWARERQDLLLERSVSRHAARLGFTDPADAMSLLDRSALEFDREGQPRNLEQQLQALARSKPYLLGRSPAPGSFDTGTGPGTGRPTGTATYSRQQLRDPVFFREHEADIRRAQMEGRITG